MQNHAENQTSCGAGCNPIVNQLAVLMAAACKATELGADIKNASQIVASLVELELYQPYTAHSLDQALPNSTEDTFAPEGSGVLGIDSSERIDWKDTEYPVKKEVVGLLRNLNAPFVLRNLVTKELHVATFDRAKNELVLRVGYCSTRKAEETRIPIAGGAYRWAFVGSIKEVAAS